MRAELSIRAACVAAASFLLMGCPPGYDTANGVASAPVVAADGSEVVDSYPRVFDIRGLPAEEAAAAASAASTQLNEKCQAMLMTPELAARRVDLGCPLPEGPIEGVGPIDPQPEAVSVEVIP